MTLSSNIALGGWPGNVFVPAWASPLHKDSVAVVTSISTTDKAALDDPIGRLSANLLDEISRGLKAVLAIR